MFAYIVRRILATIPVMAVVALFVFSLLYLSPGDPAAIIAGDTASPDDIARIHAEARARPAALRPVRQLGLAPAARRPRHLDLHQPAGLPPDRAAHRADRRIDPLDARSSRCWRRCRWGCSRRGRPARWIDRAVMVFAVLGFSVPVFVLAYFLIYVFAISTDLLPVQGYVSIRERLVAVPVAHRAADASRSACRLYRADRAHDARQHARRAGAGLHPHRPGQGPRERARC